jgi:hypothetical protein
MTIQKLTINDFRLLPVAMVTITTTATIHIATTTYQLQTQ